MSEFTNILYETPEPAIARIWLNRPDSRNSQTTDLLHELNDAFDKAIADHEVKVIILAAKGPHFSSGHDFQEEYLGNEISAEKRVGTWANNDWEGVEAYYCREKEIFEGYCIRWRDLSKPTIASVHGKAIGGALMLIWPCDLVVASEDATFQDNTMFMGLPGVEYFAHAWELGLRKAKEFLFTGLPITAHEAQEAGMVNRVVVREDLEEETLKLARQVANKPSFALKLAKDTLNATFSAQGFENVQRAAFNAHQLAHTHYRLSQDNSLIDRTFLDQFASRKTKK